ncbi:hypothetical protein B296_00003213 [Ensete ventricosum]|uniref:S-adenosylmethionine synthetase central domain-containing protein n=1 Tax=Ensete ventricosum TaxID=4639 RepID=A0A427AAR8_ENSVE|nr:hypothetical protein B296_00003213 [Ensete ventricosum]
MTPLVPLRVHTVLISTQHDETVTNDEIATDLKEHVIKLVIPEQYLDEKTSFHLMAMLGLPAARSSSTPTAVGEPMAVAPSPARTRPRLTVATPTSLGRQAAKSIVAGGLARRCIDEAMELDEGST